MPDNETILKVRDLSVRFERAEVPAVRHVSFDLGAERVGIVGESGSGKSTLGRAIMRLLPPSARVEAETLDFEAAPLLDRSEKAMRGLRGNRIALIMQDPRYSLNPVLKVGKQVAEAALLHQKIGKKRAFELAADMLGKVRIADVERTMELYPHQISGGMGQRVMIAMMLLAKPRLVIADEPTSALDVSVRGDVLRLLDQLVRENNSALLLISHDIRMVASFCERILVMYQGQVIETLQSLNDAKHPYTRGLIAHPKDCRPTNHYRDCLQTRSVVYAC
ncbi:ABC transporter ATP-binding protein [Agrobacterium rubi]|uniref:ABC transporter ATP-binding protein n=1 Tax=Agrobacterium rubi TaxID=28099 RepID=UPI001572F97A|nr:ABC transporter ATP-binding protein [Agrobacterium rubi]